VFPLALAGGGDNGGALDQGGGSHTDGGGAVSAVAPRPFEPRCPIVGALLVNIIQFEGS
jgi:hypothetical protein